MSNKVHKEMEKIELPGELSDRSKAGVSQAKQEMKHRKPHKYIKRIGLVAAIIAVVALVVLLNQNSINHQAVDPNEPIISNGESVEIPAIQLPENSESADMIGLIIYNDKIYTQTSTEVNEANAGAMIDKKLGTTKGTIDEWSEQDAYSEEFASTIGIIDIYSVKGYDQDFRIMSYSEDGGYVTAEFYESLTGVTLRNGADLFGKLNIIVNLKDVQWRTYSDWNYNIDNYHIIKDMDEVNDFIEALNQTRVHIRDVTNDPMSHARNQKNEDFRELRLRLTDGSIISLLVIRGGYIYYGGIDVYFEMNNETFANMWDLLH